MKNTETKNFTKVDELKVYGKYTKNNKEYIYIGKSDVDDYYCFLYKDKNFNNLGNSFGLLEKHKLNPQQISEDLELEIYQNKDEKLFKDYCYLLLQKEYVEKFFQNKIKTITELEEFVSYKTYKAYDFYPQVIALISNNAILIKKKEIIQENKKTINLYYFLFEDKNNYFNIGKFDEREPRTSIFNDKFTINKYETELEEIKNKLKINIVEFDLINVERYINPVVKKAKFFDGWNLRVFSLQDLTKYFSFVELN